MKNYLLVFILISFTLLPTLAYSQCYPRSGSVPPHSVIGDIKCVNSSVPTNVKVLFFRVNGIACPDVDYDLYYPYVIDGQYRLDFWMDLYSENEISICLQVTCGSNTSSGGFSNDGITPYTCDNIITVPALQIISAVSIVIPDYTLPFSIKIPIIIFLIFTILFPIYLFRN